MWRSTFRLEYRIPRFQLQRRWLLKRGPGLTDMGAEPVAAGTASGRGGGGVYMSLSSRVFGIAGWRRRYCGFVFAGRSRRE